MRPSIRLLILVVCGGAVSGCSNRTIQAPASNGPAVLITSGRAYHAFFPATYSPGFYCGADSLGHPTPFAGRFTPDPARIAAHEATFRAAYESHLVSEVERMHPDSTLYVVEIRGAYGVGSQMSRRDLIRARRRHFERSVEWDRQYAGFLDSRGDSVLVINMVDPKLARRGLAESWTVGFDDALNHITTVGYNSTFNTVNLECEALYPDS